MYKYDKKLPYPVDVKKKDIKMAKLIITQFGGPNGELGAFLRYFCHKFNMPTPEGAALLNDIATEEMGHCEMICTMVYQLLKDVSLDELQQHGLTANYVEHGKGIYPSDSFGIPFNAGSLQSTGDPITDLAEDMAAEEKARSTYENLIDMTEDPDLINPLLFLRQREIVHFARFKELHDKYKKMGY
ncbi:MAG: manganese catalase family protein [Bacilli bacterium]|nr:manganese catalase family protein [Bacilli bacterium]